MAEEPAPKTDLKAVHRRAMSRFDDCAWPTQELRGQSLAARRFVSIPGAQWEDRWGEQFANSIMVEVNKVGRGLRKIENDYRENRIISDFRPDGDKADQETADTLDGMYRADAYRFKAQQAIDNACSEAFAGGFGAWRLSNEWEDESDRDNDNQRINPGSIIVDADQSVFFDPNARLYDKSDARYGFVRVALSADAFKEEYGESRAIEFPEGTSWRMQDWFTPDTCAVAEYYEREEVSDTLWIMTHRLSREERRMWAGETQPGDLAEMERGGWIKSRQNRKRWRVRKYVLSGAEVLEDCGHIAGDRIPIVPVYGQRWFVEGMERWKGYVQDKMDPQRLYNSNVSRLAEINSQSPFETPIFAPEQMPPHISSQWARANIDRLPFLLAEPLRDGESGAILAAGPTGNRVPTQLPPVTAALMQIANGDLLEDMEDGADTVKANTSEGAMELAAQRVDAKSGIYLDNVRQSIQCGGEIYLAMAAEVYVEPLRSVETMSEDGDDGKALLKRPKTGDDGKHRTINDFQGARYKVIASVTEATATRRDKTVRSAINLAEIATQAGDAELAQVSLLTAVQNGDGEGMNDLQAYARKRLVGMGVVPPNDDEKRAMEEAQGEQQPDPLAELAAAQSQEALANAALKAAQAGKAEADTGLSKAKTIETMANVGVAASGVMRESEDRQMIRRGSEMVN